MSILILFSLALAPTMAIAIFIYLRDKYDREPLRWLLFAFMLGMISLVLPVFFENLIEPIGIRESSDLWRTLVYAFLGVGFSEEIAKFAVLRVFVYKKKYYDEPMDGIVYSVMISMGFASLENVMYVFNSSTPIQTALVRAFTAVPAHGVFAVILGYYLGKARFTYSFKRTSVLVKGLIAAILFHGSYDAFLFYDNYSSYNLDLGAFATLVIGVIISLIMIRKMQINSPYRKRERWKQKMQQARLPENLEKIELQKQALRNKYEKQISDSSSIKSADTSSLEEPTQCPETQD